LLVLFDVLGRGVSVLVNEVLKAGEYNVTLDASSLSGIYFTSLKQGFLKPGKWFDKVKNN
jgi:hypothetical protein